MIIKDPRPTPYGGYTYSEIHTEARIIFAVPAPRCDTNRLAAAQSREYESYAARNRAEVRSDLAV
jgi:hypothetical protein